MERTHLNMDKSSLFHILYMFSLPTSVPHLHSEIAVRVVCRTRKQMIKGTSLKHSISTTTAYTPSVGAVSLSLRVCPQ